MCSSLSGCALRPITVSPGMTALRHYVQRTERPQEQQATQSNSSALPAAPTCGRCRWQVPPDLDQAGAHGGLVDRVIDDLAHGPSAGCARRLPGIGAVPSRRGSVSCPALRASSDQRRDVMTGGALFRVGPRSRPLKPGPVSVTPDTGKPRSLPNEPWCSRR